MNTPTKRIFYLFGPKFAKNEPQNKVWGSLTCKSQWSLQASEPSWPLTYVRAHIRGRSHWSRVFAPFALLGEVLGERSDHAFCSSLAKDVGRLCLVHEDTHQALEHLYLTAVTHNA